MTIFLAACLGIEVDDARAQANATAQDKAKEPPKPGSSNADIPQHRSFGGAVSPLTRRSVEICP